MAALAIGILLISLLGVRSLYRGVTGADAKEAKAEIIEECGCGSLEECLVKNKLDCAWKIYHEDQKEIMSSSNIKKLVDANVKLTHTIRKHLLKGDLEKFGGCLDAGWQIKRNLSSMISNNHIDAIYNGAIENGASGGKLLGAGGGGYFIFHVHPFKKFQL